MLLYCRVNFLENPILIVVSFEFWQHQNRKICCAFFLNSIFSLFFNSNSKLTMSRYPSRYPPTTSTRSHTARNAVTRLIVLNQFIVLSVPISNRINAVVTGMLGQPRPLTAVEQNIYDQMNMVILNVTQGIFNLVARFANPNYFITGSEISQALRILTGGADRAELLLRMLQNPNRVRRKLTYD